MLKCGFIGVISSVFIISLVILFIRFVERCEWLSFGDNHLKRWRYYLSHFDDFEYKRKKEYGNYHVYYFERSYYPYEIARIGVDMVGNYYCTIMDSNGNIIVDYMSSSDLSNEFGERLISSVLTSFNVESLDK
jgi:hypothetical protein